MSAPKWIFTTDGKSEPDLIRCETCKKEISTEGENAESVALKHLSEFHKVENGGQAGKIVDLNY